MAKAKFPKVIYVWLEPRGLDVEIKASDTIDGAAYGLNTGDTMQIGKYLLDDEPCTYAARLHYIPKGAKAK